MNWNYPAFLYGGNKMTYAVELVLEEAQLSVFEPTTQQFIVSCPYNEMRVFRDLETQTLFRIVIDKKPLVFASPFRAQLLGAL